MRQRDRFKHVAARLDAARIGYMLTGSIAAGVYGQPRMTRDIDVVAVLYPITRRACRTCSGRTS